MAGIAFPPFLLRDGLEEHKSLLRANGIAKGTKSRDAFRHARRKAWRLVLMLRLAGAGGPGMSSQPRG